MSYRIAVLDDDAVQLQRAEEMLQRYAGEHPEYGLEVSVYPRMTAFMEAVCGRDESGRWPFDLLLMDVYLPDGNGIESARLLRQQGFRSGIIFQSSSAGNVTEAFLAGALDYLVKPFTWEALDRVLGKAIEGMGHDPVPEAGEEASGREGSVPHAEKRRGSLFWRGIFDSFRKAITGKAR